MTDRASQNRPRMLVWIVWTVCGLTTVTSVVTLLLTGSFNPIALLFTYAMSYLLYRRRSWARWVAGILWTVAGIFTASAAFVLEGEQAVLMVVTLIMGLTFVCCGTSLLAAKSIRKHFTRSDQSEGDAKNSAEQADAA